MAIVAAPPTSSAPDPVDVIDAADLVDGDNDDDVNDDVNDNDGDDMDDDGVKEFHAFETASTLEPATVETAQLLAQEANEGLPSSPKKQKDIMDVTANNNISSMSKLSLSSITHEGGATTTTTNSLLADTTSTSTTTTMTTTGGGERSSSSHSLVDDDGKPISEQEQSQKDKNRFVTPKDFELLKVIGIGAFVSCVAANQCGVGVDFFGAMIYPSSFSLGAHTSHALRHPFLVCPSLSFREKSCKFEIKHQAKSLP